MKYIAFILICLSYLFSACTKCPEADCINPPCKVDTTKVISKDSNLVWQFNADTVQNSNVSMQPILYNNTVLFSAGSELIGDPFMLFDKKSGKVLNIIYDQNHLTIKTASRHQYKNYCVITDWNYVYLLDLEKNIQIKNFNLNDLGYDGEPRIYGFEQLVFLNVKKLSNPRKEYTTTWLCWNLLTDEMNEILTIEDKGTFESSFESLGFWFKSNGDTVIIFQNRQYDFKNAERRIDMYAYNLTQKTYEWKIDSFTITGNTSIFPIIVKEDRFYFQGSNEAFCFSCVDGHKIWNRYFKGEGFFRTNAVLAEGKYIMKGESDLMYALDENTGATVWENPKAGHSNKNMIYHNGRVFYETGQDGLGVLRGLRVSNGQVEWTYFSSNYPKYSDVSFGLSGIAIDSETNYIYSNDRVFHMCVKLPK